MACKRPATCWRNISRAIAGERRVFYGGNCEMIQMVPAEGVEAKLEAFVTLRKCAS
jgi:hypothetical protein